MSKIQRLMSSISEGVTEVNYKDYGLGTPKQDGVLNATLVDGTKVRLGIIAEQGFGGESDYRYAYVTEDLSRFSYGGFSGGSVGLGLNLQKFSDYRGYSEKKFVGFVKV